MKPRYLILLAALTLIARCAMADDGPGLADGFLASVALAVAALALVVSGATLARRETERHWWKPALLAVVLLGFARVALGQECGSKSPAIYATSVPYPSKVRPAAAQLPPERDSTVSDFVAPTLPNNPRFHGVKVFESLLLVAYNGGHAVFSIADRAFPVILANYDAFIADGNTQWPRRVDIFDYSNGFPERELIHQGGTTMYRYPDGKGGDVIGPAPIDLNDPIYILRESDLLMFVREIEDLVASDLLAPDRGEELVGLIGPVQ